MRKYLSILLFIHFLSADTPVFCQTSGDSTETVAENNDQNNVTLADSGFMKESVRQVPQKQVRSYLKDPAYAYANDPEYWKKPVLHGPNPLLQFLFSKALRWIVFVVIFLSVLWGLYRLARENNFIGFTQKRKKLKTVHHAADINVAEDFNLMIQNHQASGNFRMAIRYLYLRLIHTAVEKKHVQILESSTNAAITNAFKNPQQAGEFRVLATAYEYVFYGGFLPNRVLFDKLKLKFDHFQETLSI